MRQASEARLVGIRNDLGRGHRRARPGGDADRSGRTGGAPQPTRYDDAPRVFPGGRSVPTPGPSSTAPAAIRSRVRDAVARAWDAAAAEGTLPAVEDGAAAP